MSSMGRIRETAERREAARVPLSVVPALPSVRAILRPAAEAVAALAEEWTALADSASEPNAFAEHWFVAAALRTLPEGRDIRLIEARRGERLIGPLMFQMSP